MNSARLSIRNVTPSEAKDMLLSIFNIGGIDVQNYIENADHFSLAMQLVVRLLAEGSHVLDDENSLRGAHMFLSGASNMITRGVGCIKCGADYVDTSSCTCEQCLANTCYALMSYMVRGESADQTPFDHSVQQSILSTFDNNIFDLLDLVFENEAEKIVTTPELFIMFMHLGVHLKANWDMFDAVIGKPSGNDFFEGVQFGMSHHEFMQWSAHVMPGYTIINPFVGEKAWRE